MTQKKDLTEGKGAIEIIEEATQLLRSLPADVYALYYIGSLPFILGFLYFWADMSRGAFAYQYAAEAAFSLSALYIWMKCWQAVFCLRLHTHLLEDFQTKWNLSRIMRLIILQTAIQPFSLIAVPVASALMLPFAWVYAFFHNVSVIGNGHHSDIKDVYRESWHQARLFPAQNHILIMIYSMFGIFVFINLAIIFYLFPKLLNTFLGVETFFSRATWGMFNTTLLMTTIGTSYLVLNPLAKAIYVLRCFYGQSLQTGTDLKVELNKFAKSINIHIATILLLFLLSFGWPVNAVSGTDNDVTGINKQMTFSVISASELDNSINEIISKREYSWRMPKEKNAKKEESGIIGKFISGLIETIKNWLKPVKKWLKSVAEWILEKLKERIKYTPDYDSSSINWMETLRTALYALIAIATLILGFILLRVVRTYRSGKTAIESSVTTSKPDITKEDTQAGELPADSWLEMAENLLARGDLRSALRAMYLGCLALLARQKVIVIARFKSNREYERELYRKAHNVPELLTAFSNNMRTFEGIWYGNHQVTGDTVRLFKENQTRITDIANKL
jgi:hypothetical protein